MTPAEIITAARQKYGAETDNFWVDAELLQLIYAAEMEIFKKNFRTIEETFSTTTVAGTQEYAYPTNTFAIKRITYDGKRLEKINYNEDDLVTGLNSDVTTRGTPRYYLIWENTIILRPIPDAALTLKVYSFNRPQQLTAITASLDVPDYFHSGIVDYVVSNMYAKDKDMQFTQYYRKLWDDCLMQGLALIQEKQRGSGFAGVQDETGTYAGVLSARI